MNRESELNFDDFTTEELDARDAMFERMFPKTKTEQNDVAKGADDLAGKEAK